MAPHRKQASKPSAPTMKWITQWMSVVILSFVALFFALGAPFIFGHTIKEGEIAERNYVAPADTQIVDLLRTREAQDALREGTFPVFQRSAEAEFAALGKLSSALSPDGGAQDESLQRLLSAVGKEDYLAWRTEVERATRRVMSSSILLPGESSTEWQRRVFEYLPESWTVDLRNQSATLIANCLVPNVTIDAVATHEAMVEQVAHMQPIKKSVKKGTLLIQKGEIITSDDVATLSELGITHSRDLHSLLAIATSLVAAFFFFGILLYTFEPEFFFSPSAIALMATVSVVTSGIASTVGKEYAPFVPLPATALVLSVIFGKRIALVLVTLVILFLRISELIDNAHLLALAAASAVALGTTITKRKDLMLSGILIGMIQSIAYFFAVIFGGMAGSAIGMGRELVGNLLGGLSSSIIAIGSLPYLEGIFGILTPFRVAELSEPDQPLLRRLEENAPGTYQHSLAVANLAEAGAKAINADVNLVRAGAMYHDIGKMVTPRFFIENQLGDKNPHDEIAPEESRAKVLAHVTNGLVLAQKYGLPEKIQAFIPEHQGTTVMAYFYHKACMRDGVQNVKESDYRYPGPKPQTKETAIVMLADVSEAVTHSMHDPTQEQVEQAIGNVFKARWDDGQFNESDLTADELERVKRAFVRVWRTLHHERLKYPSTTTGRMPVVPQFPSESPADNGGNGQTQPAEKGQPAQPTIDCSDC